MQRKQLKRTLESLQLELVKFTNGTGNCIDIVLQAPDGATNKFQISRLDDPGSDKQNITQMRRFAKEHSTTQVFPEIEELDVVFLDVTPKPPSDMEAAVMATCLENDPKTKAYAERVYRKKPLVNPVGMLVSGASTPIPQEDPMPARIEAIESFINKEIEMPKPALTIANPKTLEDKDFVALQKQHPDNVRITTTVRKPKTIDRIGQVEFFKLCTVLTTLDMVGINSFSKLAEKLTKAYGRKISQSTAEDALKATGMKLDKLQVDATDAQIIIARTLTALLIKLSEPVPEELRKLCGDIE